MGWRWADNNNNNNEGQNGAKRQSRFFPNSDAGNDMKENNRQKVLIRHYTCLIWFHQKSYYWLPWSQVL